MERLCDQNLLDVVFSMYGVSNDGSHSLMDWYHMVCCKEACPMENIQDFVFNIEFLACWESGSNHFDQ